MTPAAYAVAMADSETCGSRWLISLDSHFAGGLGADNAASRSDWRKLVQTLEFFCNRRQAPEMQPRGALAVLSDFSGANEFLSHEFLNLIARENVPTRILIRSAPPATLAAGVRMVVYLDSDPIAAGWRQVLSEFVRAGGTVMLQRSADPGFGTRSESIAGLDYDLRSYGKGRWAVAAGGFDEPSRVAADAHILLGRRNDLLRLANAGSCNGYFSGSVDRKHASLQIVNYSGRPGLNPVTVTLLEPYHTAKFRSLERPEDAEIPIRKEYGRTVLELPEFSIYGRVDLEL
jgi:hypothetical protein